MRLILIPAILAFVLDQASKYAVVFGLDLINRQVIDVIPPLLVFKMGWNTGINFGLLGSNGDVMRWALVALAVGISAWILWWAPRNLTRVWAKIGAGLLVGGALGNGLDRVIHGAVMDFLNMSCCGISNPFAFNVADIFIFAGAIGLIFLAEDNKDTSGNSA